MAEHLMSSEASHGDRTLGDLCRTARTNARFAVVACVGFIALAFAIIAMAPPTYVASAQVLVPATPASLSADPLGRQRVVTVDTEAHRAYSDTAMAAVKRATGVADPRRAVRVSALPVTRVLVLEFRDSDPALAGSGVRAWTQAYLQEQSASIARRSAAALDTLADIPVHEAAARSTALARGDPSSAWKSTIEAQSRREYTLRERSMARGSTVKQGLPLRERKPWGTWVAGALMIGTLAGVAVAIARRSDSGATSP